MVPLPYFLALLVVLVSLMGCTQKAPPGSLQKNNTTSSFNTTNLVDASPSPVPNQTLPNTIGGKPTTPPSLPADFSGVQVLPINGSEWQLSVLGLDAEELFGLLEVEKADSIKIGKHITCTRAAKATTCSIFLQSGTGEILAKDDSSKTKTALADFALRAKYSSNYFELDVPVLIKLKAKDENETLVKYGRLSILGDNGRSIFENLSVPASKLIDSDTAQDRSEKKGKNVDCIQETLKSDGKTYHTCKFYFDYDTGAFEEIL